MTEWRTVPGYSSYSVSCAGEIRRDASRTCGKAGRILKPSLRNGYPFVDLCENGRRRAQSIHQLVMLAFHGEPGGQVINHIDGDRTNNRLENLEYTTQRDNCRHAFAIGHSSYKGIRNGQAKLTEDDVRQIRGEHRGTRGENKRVAKLFNVSDTNVRVIVARKIWTHI